MIRKMLLRDHACSEWLMFEAPSRVLTARSLDEVIPTLLEVERHVHEEQSYSAGYLSYEAAAGFDESLVTQSPGQLPLLCFGLFSEPRRFSDLPAPTPATDASSQWTLATSYAAYLNRIEEIKRQIALGNSYQVNLTIRQHAEGMVDPWTFFLHTARESPYAAYLEFDDFAIISASPELLFRLDGDDLTCRPMKGTAERGMTLTGDLEQKRALRNSTKDRAENVMVTDMLRNDMGRVAVPGTVSVTELFAVEKYPTLWQMTSSIAAKSNASIVEILRALFPCASVTGAPKASSMAIIEELEESPREIYTGSIGYFGPHRQAQFNVAIRTAWVDRKIHRATYGTGGGIVWDSVADDEYKECLTKTRVLASSIEDSEFELLETMRWTRDDGYFLLERHLDRLSDTADYFDFDLDRADIEAELMVLGSGFAGNCYRIRLLTQRNGTFRLTKSPHADDSPKSTHRIKLSAIPIDAANPFLYHKTTRRNAYSDARMSVAECDDVLMWNKDGLITETTIANVVVRIDGELLTPPIRCGLLAGTFRQSLLEQGIIKEGNIHRDDLAVGQEIMLVNSVREWYEGQLIDDAETDSMELAHSAVTATIR